MSEPSNFKTRATEKLRKRRERKVWWSRAKTAAKGIIGFSALVAAIVAILAWLPLARDTVAPSLKEYETLRTLYAGASVSFFDAKLGPPSIVSPLGLEKGTMERLYVKKDYVVETLATAEGETTLFSVLSCNPSFKPTFGDITLQSESLATVQHGAGPQLLFYEHPGTAGGPEFFFEMMYDVAGYTNYRGAGYGVNRGHRCGDLPDNDVESYRGSETEAPQGIKDYRTRTPANFYVETYGRSFAGLNGETEPFFLVTPTPVDLPPHWPERTNGLPAGPAGYIY